MYDKRESFVISYALSVLEKKYSDQSNELYEKISNPFEFSKEDEEKNNKLNEQIREIREIRNRFDFERNVTSWHKLIKRAFKKMLLKKCIKWLSE